MEIDLIREIKHLKQKIGRDVSYKLKKIGNVKSKEKIFLELCFCILVANCSVKKVLEIWKKVGKGFYLPEKSLRKKLKKLGYRFYNKRANYIVLARKSIKEICIILKSKNEEEIRSWLVKNIKGIGWKEASHFLRNLGFKNFAILDRHVLKVLKRFKIINKIPKSLSKKEYIKIEKILKKIADKINISLAELDLYLFYLNTEKICEK